MAGEHVTGRREDGEGRRGADDAVVLVCDDDPSVVALIQNILEDLPGVRSVAAYDGEEALALAEKIKPALLLLDLRIPRIDGAMVARRLKATEATSAVPIVAVSALSSGPRIAREAGCDGWISKPFDVEELAYVVRLFLGHSGPVHQGTGEKH